MQKILKRHLATLNKLENHIPGEKGGQGRGGFPKWKREVKTAWKRDKGRRSQHRGQESKWRARGNSATGRGPAAGAPTALTYT